MKKFLILIILLIFHNSLFASTFDDLRDIKKTSYLDFLLLKIENKLIQRHGAMSSQLIPFRIQYQSIGTEVNFLQESSKIEISIYGIMDKQRYTKKKYIPKLADCNVLRNVLLYGKYGYNFILQKRNNALTNQDMEDIFITSFLKNLTLEEKEKEFILQNTFVKVHVVDSVHGKDVMCEGKVAEDLL